MGSIVDSKDVVKAPQVEMANLNSEKAITDTRIEIIREYAHASAVRLKFNDFVSNPKIADTMQLHNAK